LREADIVGSVRSDHLHGLTIRVVDDHRDTVDMLAMYLMSVGATVHTSYTAREGVAIAATLVLDAVIVDLKMPREDGYWFLGELRASPNPGAAVVPVFALSGDHRHEQESLDRGFAAFFLKPVKLENLLAHLVTLAGIRRAP
jgi:CheY-like chemotaxis protein